MKKKLLMQQLWQETSVNRVEEYLFVDDEGNVEWRFHHYCFEGVGIDLLVVCCDD